MIFAPGSTFTMEGRRIWMVQVEKCRGVTTSVDAAITDLVKPHNLYLPGLSSQCLTSPLQTRNWPIVWMRSLVAASKTSSSMYKESLCNWYLRLNRREVTTTNPSSPKEKVMGTPSPFAQITTRVDFKLPKLWGAIVGSAKIQIDLDNWWCSTFGIHYIYKVEMDK
jgi:hypothetical protein